jgi:hypothetical protein
MRVDWPPVYRLFIVQDAFHSTAAVTIDREVYAVILTKIVLKMSVT